MKEMEELMKGIDDDKWACKTENCHKSCDSHPCLIEEGMRSITYPKTWHQQLYEVLDGLAYKRYWIGKRPSSRALFEEWLRDPDASMFEVSKRHGKYSWTIQVHVTAMNKLGILTRRKQDV